MISFSKYEYRWALIFTFVAVLWTVFEYEMGWHELENFNQHFYFTYLFIIPAIICFLLFYYDKITNRFKKRFKFQHALSSGISLSVLIAIFNIPFQYIIHKLVTIDYLKNLGEYLVDEHSFSEDFTNYLTINNSMWVFPILLFALGLLITLIFSTFFRKSFHLLIRDYGTFD